TARIEPGQEARNAVEDADALDVAPVVGKVSTLGGGEQPRDCGGSRGLGRMRVVVRVGEVQVLGKRHRIQPYEAAGGVAAAPMAPGSRRRKKTTAKPRVQREPIAAAKRAARRCLGADLAHARLAANSRPASANKAAASATHRADHAMAAPSMPARSVSTMR